MSENYFVEFPESRLIRAVDNRSGVGLLKQIVADGIPVNWQNKQLGETALMRACMHGIPEIVHFLLENGADPDIQNHTGKSALMFAAHTNADVLKLVIPFVKNMNAIDRDGYNALMHAVSYGFLECTALLLKTAIDLDAQDNDGNTALCLATLDNHYVKVELLLRAGAKIDTVNHQSESALDIARKWDFTKIENTINRYKEQQVLKNMIHNKHDNIFTGLSI